MESILEEIRNLRNNEPFEIDFNNSNRYRIVVCEADGSRTAYYFSSPIYNFENKKLVDIKFHRTNDVICVLGSNANIQISKNILLKNLDGFCCIELEDKPEFISNKRVKSGKYLLEPTLNGIVIKGDITNGEKIYLTLDIGEQVLYSRTNDKCIALMKEQFKPLIVVSSIGAFNEKDELVSPARMEFHRITSSKYMLVISTDNLSAQSIMVECNLYENKLFQDTTVESGNPTVNNAFGTIAFIGTTETFGVQWLYSRLDYSRFTELLDKQIKKVIWHLPQLNESSNEMSAYNVAARFCSFGSNWNNRVSNTAFVADSKNKNGYQSIDITTVLVDGYTKKIIRREGIILKPKMKYVGFSAVSTSDSYYAPQILEIRYI